MFDRKDFAANPEKYKLFQTARIAKQLAGDTAKDYPIGRHVSITYFDSRINKAAAGDPVEPIYVINNDIYLFANALDSFVL